jgi:bifunctional UDP-N-acetylglucosamine pyrophosphorylase/glucosamine-1-phosphate N-acetyltransferase
VNIGRGCRIGPFAYLRDGTELEDDVVLGVFTEVKNSLLKQSSRIRHLSYIGDAKVGERANVGAGTITANFDGEKVNPTNVEDDTYIGSGSVLVAPIRVEKGMRIAPGSTISQEDLKDGKK